MFYKKLYYLRHVNADFACFFFFLFHEFVCDGFNIWCFDHTIYYETITRTFFYSFYFLSPPFFVKKISNFASKMQNFASWKGKFCKNFAMFLHCLISFSAMQIVKYCSHTPTKPYIFFLIKCRLLKNDIISLMEVDL